MSLEVHFGTLELGEHEEAPGDSARPPPRRVSAPQPADADLLLQLRDAGKRSRSGRRTPKTTQIRIRRSPPLDETHYTHLPETLPKGLPFTPAEDEALRRAIKENPGSDKQVANWHAIKHRIRGGEYPELRGRLKRDPGNEYTSYSNDDANKILYHRYLRLEIPTAGFRRGLSGGLGGMTSFDRSVGKEMSAHAK